jgi:hypothetical protein
MSASSNSPNSPVDYAGLPEVKSRYDGRLIPVVDLDLDFRRFTGGRSELLLV